MRTLTWRTAAVVAVLLVGGACGNSEGGSGAGDGKRPLLPIGSSTGGAARSSAMSAEIASDTAAPMMYPAQVVDYELADGVKAPATVATAYEVRPIGGAFRAKVAKALGVDEGHVQVGPSGIEWYYSGDDPDGAVASSGVAVACAPEGSCPQPEKAPMLEGVPSAADAERMTKEILGKLDASGAGSFEVTGEDGYTRSVLYTPEVDGHPVAGMQTSVAFGEHAEIQYANGYLAKVEPVGEYPLVSLVEAMERFERGFGGGGIRTMTGVDVGGVEAVPSQVGSVDPAEATDAPKVSGAPTNGGGSSSGNTGSGGSATSAGSAQDAPPPPMTSEPGEPCAKGATCPDGGPTMTIEPQPPVQLDPVTVEITGVELVLQLLVSGCPGDPVYLVPAFEFLPGPIGSVPAVTGDSLVGSADPDAPLEPCPGQTEPDMPMGKHEPAPLPARP